MGRKMGSNIFNACKIWFTLVLTSLVFYFPFVYLCPRVPNAGSFIRPTANNISYGVSFLAALTEKYIEIPRSSSGKETVTLGSSNGTIEVEAVGLDKIRAKLSRLDSLREVSLDNREVASADQPGSIGNTCPGE